MISQYTFCVFRHHIMGFSLEYLPTMPFNPTQLYQIDVWYGCLAMSADEDYITFMSDIDILGLLDISELIH